MMHHNFNIDTNLKRFSALTGNCGGFLYPRVQAATRLSNPTLKNKRQRTLEGCVKPYSFSDADMVGHKN